MKPKIYGLRRMISMSFVKMVSGSGACWDYPEMENLLNLELNKIKGDFIHYLKKVHAVPGKITIDIRMEEE